MREKAHSQPQFLNRPNITHNHPHWLLTSSMLWPSSELMFVSFTRPPASAKETCCDSVMRCVWYHHICIDISTYIYIHAYICRQCLLDMCWHEWPFLFQSCAQTLFFDTLWLHLSVHSPITMRWEEDQNSFILLCTLTFIQSVCPSIYLPVCLTVWLSSCCVASEEFPHGIRIYFFLTFIVLPENFLQIFTMFVIYLKYKNRIFPIIFQIYYAKSSKELKVNTLKLQIIFANTFV